MSRSDARGCAEPDAADDTGWEDPRRPAGWLIALVAVLAAVVAGVVVSAIGGGGSPGGEEAAIPVTEGESQADDEASPLPDDEQAAAPEEEAPPAAAQDPVADTADPVGSWRPIPEAPITGRWGSLAVWTGEEVLIWGGWSGRMGGRGGDALADGAAYDPEADAWRPIAEAPRPALGWEETAVWTGEEMVVLGADAPLAYDPDADSWRDVAPPPEGDWVWESAGWAGGHIVVASAGRDDLAAGAVIAYSPEADGWRALPDPPLADWDGRSSAWLDGRLLLMGATDGREWERSGVAVLDPVAEEWAPAEDAPVGGRWLPRLAGDPAGRRLLAATAGDPSPEPVYEWTPQRGWRRLPELPASPLREWAALVGTARGLLAWEPEAPPRGAVLRGDAEWAPVADPHPSARFGSVSAWTGEELVVWGGGRGLRRERDGAALALPPEP